jgi:hypothetical protein
VFFAVFFRAHVREAKSSWPGGIQSRCRGP